MANILAVGAHSDDYEWGCGGSLLVHKEKGDKVYGLVMAGTYQSPELTDKQNEENRIRLQECREAGSILGLDDIFFAKLPDGGMTGLRKEANELRNLVGKLNVTRIYAPYPKDDHGDHRATNLAVKISSDNVKEVLIYPGPRNQGFEEIETFQQLTREQLDKKIASYTVYGSQMKRGSLFVAGIEGLALFNGSLMVHGKSEFDGKEVYAEGFLVDKCDLSV